MHTPPIDRSLRLIGDTVLLDTNIEENKKTVSGLFLADDSYKGLIKGRVCFIGSELSEPEIKVGSMVLVAEFNGAVPVKFGDKVLKLYNTKDCLALVD